MNKIEKLNQEYIAITKMDDVGQIELTDKFIKDLLEDNNIEVLHYHFNLLKNREIINLFNRLRFAFGKRPKEVIEPFLLEIIQKEKSELLVADAIQLLGMIKSSKVLPYAIDNIKSSIADIRYRCIIVIGWIGTKDELPLLNERLQNEPNNLIRGYASTAMRQLWFRKIADSSDILPYLYSAITTETSDETLSMIIIVIQDLLKRKFGLQELINDRTITGDVHKAKEKIIKSLKL